jgi:hypothetical protein
MQRPSLSGSYGPAAYLMLVCYIIIILWPIINALGMAIVRYIIQAFFGLLIKTLMHISITAPQHSSAL